MVYSTFYLIQGILNEVEKIYACIHIFFNRAENVYFDLLRYVFIIMKKDMFSNLILFLCAHKSEDPRFFLYVRNNL